ncbi:MAG: hypothetical protein AMJ46_08400 [Latescibacteria bacterium DG_63]|nr:MAG: hypothetical protein AMJ46_08400 [Latescibacteria bacterium DG_63]
MCSSALPVALILLCKTGFLSGAVLLPSPFQVDYAPSLCYTPGPKRWRRPFVIVLQLFDDLRGHTNASAVACALQSIFLLTRSAASSMSGEALLI